MLASGKVVINGIYMNLRSKLTSTNDLKKMGFSWIVSPLISGLMGPYSNPSEPQIQAAPLATHLLEGFSEMIRVAVGKQIRMYSLI